MPPQDDLANEESFRTAVFRRLWWVLSKSCFLVTTFVLWVSVVSMKPPVDWWDLTTELDHNALPLLVEQGLSHPRTRLCLTDSNQSVGGIPVHESLIEVWYPSTPNKTATVTLRRKNESVNSSSARRMAIADDLEWVVVTAPTSRTNCSQWGAFDFSAGDVDDDAAVASYLADLCTTHRNTTAATLINVAQAIRLPADVVPLLLGPAVAFCVIDATSPSDLPLLAHFLARRAVSILIPAHLATALAAMML